MSRNSALITILVAALVAFIAGALWQYSSVRSVRSDLQGSQQQASTLEDQLQECRFQRSLGDLRDMAGKMYLEANLGNFDVAAGISTRFFNRVDQIREGADSDQLRTALGDISNRRDTLTAQLARLEPAARDSIQQIYSTLYNATVEGGEGA